MWTAPTELESCPNTIDRLSRKHHPYHPMSKHIVLKCEQETHDAGSDNIHIYHRIPSFLMLATTIQLVLVRQ